jgi:hypothetical protein
MTDSCDKKGRRVSMLVWIAAALLGAYLLFPTFVGLLVAWPPAFMERRTERRLVEERIQPVGGWKALARDCHVLAQQYKADGYFFWARGHTNALPPSIAALKPMWVRFSRAASKDLPGVTIVQIKVFGLHSTGGHSSPYLGLEVASGRGAERYKPKPSGPAVPGERYTTYREVSTNFYEIY